MTDLSVEFAGLKLKNPFVISSSTISRDIYTIKKAEECGASAVILKLAQFKVANIKLRSYVMPKENVLFVTGDKRLNVEQAQKLISDVKKETNLAIIANMMGEGEDYKSWAKLGKKLEEAGADMLELNVSCPGIGLTENQLNGTQFGAKVNSSKREMGAFMGQSPTLSANATRAVKEAVKIPVMVKMTPESANMSAVAKACVEAGADAISAINLPSSIPGVDVYNDGKPLYDGIKYQSYAAMCGAWIKPLALRYISQLRFALPNTPILGGGGLVDWKSTAEMLMVGATAVSYCTILMLNGFKTLRQIREELEVYMEKMFYSRLDDFRGKAQKYIRTAYDLDFEDVAAHIDKNKCIGCGKCLEIGHCEAISIIDNIAFVERKKCLGCSVCKYLCPSGAISMKK